MLGSTGPGAMALTRTRGASACAIILVAVQRAVLDNVQEKNSGVGRQARWSTILITLPCTPSGICRARSRARKTGALRLTSRCVDQLSGVRDERLSHWNSEALLTSNAGGPSTSQQRGTSETTSSIFMRSA